MKDPENITLIHTIICDDIRREDNGKMLLVGVYPDSIFMNFFPLQMQLSIWIQFKMNLTEQVTFEFELKGNALKDPAKFIINVGDEVIFNTEHTLPIIAKLPIIVVEQGSFDICYKLNTQKKMKIAKTVTIKKNMRNNFSNLN